jgi:hypothetical protein
VFDALSLASHCRGERRHVTRSVEIVCSTHGLINSYAAVLIQIYSCEKIGSGFHANTNQNEIGFNLFARVKFDSSDILLTVKACDLRTELESNSILFVDPPEQRPVSGPESPSGHFARPLSTPRAEDGSSLHPVKLAPLQLPLRFGRGTMFNQKN